MAAAAAAHRRSLPPAPHSLASRPPPLHALTGGSNKGAGATDAHHVAQTGYQATLYDKQKAMRADIAMLSSQSTYGIRKKTGELEALLAELQRKKAEEQHKTV